MFENIIGNEEVKRQFTKALENNKMSHSYLFLGIEGIGKCLIAKEIAKAKLCLKGNIPCQNCKSCLQFVSNNHPDFFEIEPENQSSIKIEQIREMQKSVQEKPIVASRKVYIINEADKMTQEAQNCLLKTLEEPPDFVTIFLIGSNENAFLSTIKSRCMIVKFRSLEKKEINEYLKKNFSIDELDENLQEAFQGSIQKAILVKDKRQEYQEIAQIVEQVQKQNLLSFIQTAELIYKAKEEIRELLEYMNLLFLKKAKKDFRYVNCIEIVENSKKRLQQNANYDMTIDNMLFHIWEEVN